MPQDSYIIQNGEIISNLRWNYERSSNYFDLSFFTECIHYQHDFFIPHGIADKNYRDYHQISSKFKYVNVSGTKWKDKLVSQGMNPKFIKVTGYPKLDKLFRKRLRYKKNKSFIKVLYAPTHNLHPEDNNSVSCHPRVLPLLKKFPNQIQIIESLHPANNNKKITHDELVDVDVVLSDSGSLVYESWALGIPVVFPSWLVKKNIRTHYPKSFEDEIYEKEIGYHADRENKLVELIYKAHEYGIDKQTEQFIEGIFPKSLRGYSGYETAKCLLDLVRK